MSGLLLIGMCFLNILILFKNTLHFCKNLVLVMISSYDILLYGIIVDKYVFSMHSRISFRTLYILCAVF